MTTDNPEQKKTYPRWFFAVLLFIPILFFVLLEIGLRIGNYGQQWETFTELSSQYPGILGLNPKVMAKYFPNLQNTPTPIFDGFDADKAENSLRIFVLGESSAAGWPYIPAASFPRVMKQKLELLYPEKKIEVVNLGVSAISSYTIRDFLPAVLKQKPDAIVIYTGHNEYYGALGAASTQSFGRNRWLVNLLLWLQDFRTVQLVQNSIREIAGSLTSTGEAKGQNETLMAKVIGESAIELNSALFQDGISQFKGNLEDILDDCKAAGVPVLLTTVASNMKDQPPFKDGDPTGQALAAYKSAQSALQNGDAKQAKVLFEKAKDLDGLRFRAPSAINQVISTLAIDYKLPLLHVDSLLSSKSEYGIVGNGLMVDHLHPNISGYRYIGLAVCDKLITSGMIPKPAGISPQAADSLQLQQFPFTPLDSVIAAMRIRILLGTYPFVPKGQPNLLTRNFKPANYLDTLAIMVVERNISIEDAHYRLADRMLLADDVTGFEKEIRVLIADRPINPVHYEKICTGLIAAGSFDAALNYLKKLEQLQPGEFTAKWLGSIYVNKADYVQGRKYLEQFVSMNESDPMVWYNLSGAYANTNAPELALQAVKRAIKLEPRYTDAIAFYRQLVQVYGLK